MFSKQYSINSYELKSSLKTALATVITTFSLTPFAIYAKVMEFDYKFFVAPFVLGAVMFIWDLGQKFFRDGTTKNRELAKEVLDQPIEEENK